MSDLPDGWTSTPISEVADLVRGVTYKKADASASPVNGYLPILRATNINGKLSLESEMVFVPDRYIRREQRMRVGDIVVATSSGSASVVGKSAELKTPWEGGFGAFCTVIRPSPELAPRYLAHMVANPRVREHWRKLAQGTSINNLKSSDLANTVIALPPFAEQGRIVAAIEEHFSRLDAGVAALGRVRQNLRRMRAAVLEAAVTGHLTDYDPSDGSGTDLLEAILNARAKYLANHPYSGSRRLPSEPDEQALPTLTSGWTWASVDQLSTRVTDGVHKKPDYVSEGIPFVTVRNLTAGPGISFENLKYITQEDHAEFCRRSEPEFGDLLVSKDGTLGVIRAIRNRRPFSIFVSVALIKPVLSDMTDYLEIALASPIVQRQMVPKGTGLQHIHLEDLRADCVPLPPLAEQKRIVTAAQSELSRLDYLESVIEGQRVRAETLRSSILRAAFAGSLSPQDPSDEPAPALLERIGAERAASKGHTPTRAYKSRSPQQKAIR